MASKFKYRLTEKAQVDLDEIVRHIAVELSNPKAAAAFLAKVQKSIERVCLFPESEPLLQNEFLPNTAVRKCVLGNYVMYYLPVLEDETVLVVRIIYGRRSTEEISRCLQK